MNQKSEPESSGSDFRRILLDSLLDFLGRFWTNFEPLSDLVLKSSDKSSKEEGSERSEEGSDKVFVQNF